jgi:hypothetical protein
VIPPALAVATAVTFVWLGMVLAISFLEAPLRFRAPQVSLRIGLGIGRLVFRALNSVEAVLAVALVVAIILASPPIRVVIATVVVVAALLVQLAVVRPRLTRRRTGSWLAPTRHDPAATTPTSPWRPPRWLPSSSPASCS